MKKPYVALSLIAASMLTAGCISRDDVTSGGGGGGGGNPTPPGYVQPAGVNFLLDSELSFDDTSTEISQSVEKTISRFNDSKTSYTVWNLEADDLDDSPLVYNCRGEGIPSAPEAQCIAIARPNTDAVNTTLEQSDITGLVPGVQYLVDIYVDNNSTENETYGELLIEVVPQDANGKSILANVEDGYEGVITAVPTGSSTGDVASWPGREQVLQQFEFTLPEELLAPGKGWVSSTLRIRLKEGGGHRIGIGYPTLSVAATQEADVNVDNSQFLSVSVDSDDPSNAIVDYLGDDQDQLDLKVVADANSEMEFSSSWIDRLSYNDGVNYAPAEGNLAAYYDALANHQGIAYLNIDADSPAQPAFSGTLLDEENRIWAATAAYHFADSHGDIYPHLAILNNSDRLLDAQGLLDGENTGLEYLHLMRGMYTAIKSANPNLQVNGFAFSGDKAFADAQKTLVKNANILGGFYDVLDSHFQPFVSPEQEPESVSGELVDGEIIDAESIKASLNTLSNLAGDKPLWITGFGLPAVEDGELRV